MKENYMFMENKLKGEYYEVFKKVEVYAVAQEYEISEIEDVMMDLLDILLEAQNAEKDVQTIIGTDIEKFCVSLFAEHKKETVATSFAGACYRYLCFLLIFEFIDFLGAGVTLQDTTDAFGYIVAVFGLFLFSTIFYAAIRPVILKWKKLKIGSYLMIETLYMFVTIYLLLSVFEDCKLYLPYYVIFIIPVLYIAIYKSVQLIKRYNAEGSILKKKDPEDKPFAEFVSKGVEEQFPGELLKNYEKMNRKREKKGKALLTPEEFTEKIRADVKSGRVGMTVALILVGFLLIGPLVDNFIKNGLLDTLLFMIVLTIGLIPAGFIFWSTNQGLRIKKKYLDECDRLEITIPEYLEQLQSCNSNEKNDNMQNGIEK